MAVANFEGFLNCGACIAWRGFVDLSSHCQWLLILFTVGCLTPKPNRGISKPVFNLKLDEKVNARDIVAGLFDGLSADCLKGLFVNETVDEIVVNDTGYSDGLAPSIYLYPFLFQGYAVFVIMSLTTTPFVLQYSNSLDYAITMNW